MRNKPVDKQAVSVPSEGDVVGWTLGGARERVNRVG